MADDKKEQFEGKQGEHITSSAVKRTKSFISSLKLIFKSLGPGVITGASDDDPSGIATFSQAGSQFGFGMLWMAL